MARRAHDHCGLLTAAALLLLMASALAGDWCENFESGAGTFWEQRSFSGRWQASTYSQESALTTAKIPKPITGESGVLVLRPWRAGAAAASRLVSPELLVSEGGAIEITYWLWYNGAPNQVTFLLYRLVNNVEDRAPFLNITAYSTPHQRQWSTMTAGLNLDRGRKIRVAIYGYLAGNAAAAIAIDRVVLHRIEDSNACEEAPVARASPTDDPGPEGPAFDFFCPTEYGLYMDPESCEYYYSCNSWLAVHMPCYTSLVFNPQTSMCDYVQHVPSCQPQAVGDVVSPAEAN